jgi:hypothetical protein
VVAAKKNEEVFFTWEYKGIKQLNQKPPLKTAD